MMNPFKPFQKGLFGQCSLWMWQNLPKVVMHLTQKNRPELPPPFLVISIHSPDTPKAFKIRHCSNLAFLLKLNLHSSINPLVIHVTHYCPQLLLTIILFSISMTLSCKDSILKVLAFSVCCLFDFLWQSPAPSMLWWMTGFHSVLWLTRIWLCSLLTFSLPILN